MSDQTLAEHLVISPQQWDLKRVEHVDGGAWRCQVCGLLGEKYMSIEAAQQAGVAHVQLTHQSLKQITVVLRVSDGGSET